MGRYSNKFVLCILVNGQVQKDLANGEVHIPFGSTYTVRLINKNNRRAVVDMFIDGEEVGSFVVKAHDRLDVKRSAHKDAAFMFVDLDSPEAYGEGKQGPNPDKTKGLIEAKFRLEKEAPKKVEHHYYPYPVYPPVVTLPVYPPQSWPRNYDTNVAWSNNITDSAMRCSQADLAATKSLSSLTAANNPVSYASGLECLSVQSASIAGPVAPTLQEGCTVEGGKTGQRWVDVHVDTEDTETVLTLFLKGFNPQHFPHQGPVVEPAPLTPSQSFGFCPHCGKARADKTHLFCGGCGNKF